MKMKQIIVLTTILVSSCTSTVPVNMTKTVNASEPIAPSSVSTKTPIPRTLSSPIPQTPSPWPTVPVFITPDADQLDRWQEYEKELATGIFPSRLMIIDVLCEWEILKKSEQKMYVWAVCSGYYSPNKSSTASLPAAINLDVFGYVQSVKTTENTPGSYIDVLQELFPMDVQERFQYYRFGGAKLMRSHIETRRSIPGPPLFVLLATPAPNPILGTPLLTQLTIVPTLNPTQEKQQEEIKSVIQEYFDIHYQALSVSTPEDFQETGFGDLVSELPEAKDFEEIEKAKLTVQAKYWEIKHLRYAEYQNSLNYDDIVVDSATYMATAFLLDRADVVRERSMEYNPEDPRITYREFRHIIVLHNEKGEWKIVSDLYLDSWWQQYRKPGATTEEILNAIHLVMQKLETMPEPTP